MLIIAYDMVVRCVHMVSKPMTKIMAIDRHGKVQN
jgi:hypothetical protein